MIFIGTVTIPANTAQTAPVIVPLPLTRGKITLMMVQFPSGVNALAHLVVNRGLHQLFPTNQDGDFASGGETIVWDEEEVIDHEPYSVNLIGWNTDATYLHTITVRVVMTVSPEHTDVGAEIAQLLAQGTPGVEGAPRFPV